MHALLTILAVTSTTAGKSSSKSSSTLPFLIIVVVFFAAYMLFIRPRSQRLRQQQKTAGQTLSVGDPVVTIGGIQGRVVAMDADVAEVEVAPGVVLTMVRRAVNPRPDAPPLASNAAPVDDDWPMSQDPLDAPPLPSPAQTVDQDQEDHPEHQVEPGDSEAPGDQSTPHP